LSPSDEEWAKSLPIAAREAIARIARSVGLAVGCISTVLGLWWGYPIIGR